MKRTLCMAILSATLVCGNTVFADILGACPHIPAGWDGKTALEGWAIDSKSLPHLQKEKKYVCYYCWGA